MGLDGGAASDAGASLPAKPSESNSLPAAVVDWQELTLRATGSGPPDFTAVSASQATAAAEKHARASALRSLERGIGTVRLTGTQTVSDVLASSGASEKLGQVLGEYRITAKRYFSDHGVELDVELPLPPIADLLLAPPAAATKVPGPKSKSSGLIVDARGLNVVPALAPRLVEQDGKEIYGIASLSAEARRRAGVAAYARAIADAKTSQRVGEKPLMVKASKAVGPDLVLSPAAARAIEESNPVYLLDGRVLIISGPPAKR